MAAKLKSKRAFIDDINSANSWYKLSVDDFGIELTLADCSRSITWYFGKKDEKTGRGKKKIAKVKKIIDEIYEYYND